MIKIEVDFDNCFTIQKYTMNGYGIPHISPSNGIYTTPSFPVDPLCIAKRTIKIYDVYGNIIEIKPDLMYDGQINSIHYGDSTCFITVTRINKNEYRITLGCPIGTG